MPLLCFSALQRAENSSTKAYAAQKLPLVAVSVLFSEPKIPQLMEPPDRLLIAAKFQCSSASRKFLNVQDDPDLPASYEVSVLFSEPKIPQRDDPEGCGSLQHSFQCSSASRKFLNEVEVFRRQRCVYVSVLFSEPKIPQRCGFRAA